MALTRRALLAALTAAAASAPLGGCGNLRAGDTAGPGARGPATGWVSPSAGLAVAGQQQQPATLLYAAVESTEATALLWNASTGLGSISRTPFTAPHRPAQTPVTATAGGAGPWVLRERRNGQVVGTLTISPDRASATLTCPGRAPEVLTQMDDGKYEELLVLHERS